ncbi:MAG: 1,2-dihydroxy-3-keto-5-methylthiopentene dioxygenase [Bradymonadia bacterium]|jgi:1,2-dihydroxy-3-keto-5-methylthiopentene dioxygenase
MATVSVRSTRDQTTDPASITELLKPHGVLYEQWDISKLSQQPATDGQSPEDHVLTVFADEVKTMCATRGYHTADVIALSESTPNLDTILAKFDKEHFHTEDEVRFVVSGRGRFIIRGKDDELYDVEVEPGDLLAVPEGTHHWFELCDDKQIQCIRLFTDMTGWVAHYV